MSIVKHGKWVQMVAKMMHYVGKIVIKERLNLQQCFVYKAFKFFQPIAVSFGIEALP